MQQQSGWTATPSKLIGASISTIPTIFTLDALPGTTLPIYCGLVQAPNMLACIPGGNPTTLMSYKSLFTTHKMSKSIDKKKTPSFRDILQLI